MDQTGLKRKGAHIDDGEADGFEVVKRRPGRGGRGRGRGGGCRGRGGRGHASGSGGKHNKGDSEDVDPAPDTDWEDVCREWEIFASERAAAWAAIMAAESGEANPKKIAAEDEVEKPKQRCAKKGAEGKRENCKKGNTTEKPQDADAAGAVADLCKEKSFARRPPPKTEQRYMMWQATKTAFEDKIALYVDHPSKFQDATHSIVVARFSVG